MKFELLQTVPGVGEKGQIVENTDFPWITFSKKSFFRAYTDPIKCLYSENEQILYYSKLYRVKEIVGNNMEIVPVNEYVNKRNTEFLKVSATANIKKIHFFWFVNSHGKVIQDYKERSGLSEFSLKYLKKMNNMFDTKDEAVARLDWVMNVK